MPKAVLFIPDISGYTKFVRNTEINHQQHILKELLELLMDQNNLELELAEVEGDALFYYKVGSIPESEEIAMLARKMFIAFHSHLRFYDSHRICHCGACEVASELTLKFVVHYGDISFLQLKQNAPKPHGPNVIVVHRLLKNDVPHDEYLLFSEGESTEEITFNKALDVEEVHVQSRDYGADDIGTIVYKYASLKHLKAYIDQPEQVLPTFKNKSPLASSIFIERETPDVFDLLLDTEKKSLWDSGVEKIINESDAINQSGENHVCIIKGNELNISTIKADFGKNKWVFGEETSVPGAGKVFFYYILKPKDGGTEVRIEIHSKPIGIIQKIIAFFLLKQFLKSTRGSLKDLKIYLEKKDV